MARDRESSVSDSTADAEDKPAAAGEETQNERAVAEDGVDEEEMTEEKAAAEREMKEKKGASEDGVDGGDGQSVPAEPIVSPPDTDGEDEGKQFTATVREIERVSASNVPTDYPISIDTARAVAMRLTVDGTEKPIFRLYFETPERGPDDRLAQLLAVAGSPAGDIERLEGESLLLTISEGYYLPVVPDGQPKGNPNAVYGVFAGLIPSAVIGLVGIFSPGASFIGTTPFILGWVIATFLLLPVSLYIDALNLQSTTNWTGGPRKWAAMAAVPGLNVAVVPLYLIARENADPVV